MEDCVLVSFVDPTNGDMPILIVGRQKSEGNLDIINAFQGKEAKEIYEKLTSISGSPAAGLRPKGLDKFQP
jgi:hypothetical protein